MNQPGRLAAITMAACAALGVAANLSAQTIISAPAFYYKFDETAGALKTRNWGTVQMSGAVSTANADVVGQTIAVNGYTGNGLQGNGSPSTSNYVDTHWKTSLTGTWSIAFWYKLVDMGNNLAYSLGGDVQANNLRLATGGTVASGARTAVTLSAVGTPSVTVGGGTANAWNHFAFIHDPNGGGAGQARIFGYLNGVLTTTITPTSNPLELVSTSNTETFQVGAWGASNSHGGMLDEFQIYTRALTSIEVNSAMQGNVAVVPEPETYAGFATASLALFWLGRRRLQAPKTA